MDLTPAFLGDEVEMPTEHLAAAAAEPPSRTSISGHSDRGLDSLPIRPLYLQIKLPLLL